LALESKAAKILISSRTSGNRECRSVWRGQHLIFMLRIYWEVMRRRIVIKYRRDIALETDR